MTSLEGELELTSNGGRVSKYGGLARFFSVLNFGEIFRGNNIDYEDEGFPYEFITASAYIEEGKLMIRYFLISLLNFIWYSFVCEC